MGEGLRTAACPGERSLDRPGTRQGFMWPIHVFVPAKLSYL